MYKKIITLFLTVLVTVLTFSHTYAQTAVVCESTHTVTAGDWLSKIAEKAFGDPKAYFPIYSATNSQAVDDASFHFIDNPDEIEIGWKLCIPAKADAPAGLDAAALGSGAYKSEYGTDGIAQLTNGKFSAPAAPGAASMNVVFLSNQIAYGTVDGVPSAALVLIESGGGSGVFSTLHLVQVHDGRLNDVANILLGDRINLTTLSIQDNQIVVGMTQQGENDPACCPTQRVLSVFARNGDKLDLASSKEVGKVEQTDTPTQPATDNAQKLMGVVWKWEQTLFNDGKLVTAADPNRYLIEFGADNRLSIQADCNRVLGTYTTQANQITLTLGPSTLVACPPDSQADEFTTQLGNVGSFLFDGDKLILEIKFDSGSMTFAPSAPMGLAGTAWDVVSYNNGNQAVVTLLQGTAITLNFSADNRVSGNAGCNTYSGGYQAQANTLKIETLVTTVRACETPAGVMEQETQYLAALQNAATYEIAGDTLTTRDADGAMQVVARKREPVTLTNTAWNVVNINNGQQAVVGLIENIKITLNFGADGTVSGNAGCNNFTGSYESGDGTLQVGPLASTKIFCASPSGVMDQEAQFLAALQNAATYEIANDQLTIRDTEGAMQVVAAR